MDRLSQADAILTSLEARGGFVVVAGRAVSPMDCQRTIPVPREVIRACEASAVEADTVGADTVGAAVVGTAEAGIVDAEMVRAASGIRPAPQGRADSA